MLTDGLQRKMFCAIFAVPFSASAQSTPDYPARVSCQETPYLSASHPNLSLNG